MKNLILLSLTSLILAGCSSAPYEPVPDQGTHCRHYQGKQDKDEGKKISCLGVNFDTDPVRFHYLAPWDRKRLPDIPDMD